jgi:hypothetical protein
VGLLQRGLWTLPIVSYRCLPCAPSRSGSFGLSRPLPGLPSDSVSRSKRTFKVFRATPPPTPHRCGLNRRPRRSLPFEAPACCPDRHVPVLSRGVGRDRPGHPELPGPSPLHRPLSRAPLSRSPNASTPRPGSRPTVRPRDANPEVPFRPRGFAPPRRFAPHPARRFIAPCCRSWGSTRFRINGPQPKLQSRAILPAMPPPLEEPLRFAVGSPVTGRLGPPAVGPLARSSTSRLFPSNRHCSCVRRCQRAPPCSSWASIPLRGHA